MAPTVGRARVLVPIVRASEWRNLVWTPAATTNTTAHVFGETLSCPARLPRPSLEVVASDACGHPAVEFKRDLSTANFVKRGVVANAVPKNLVQRPKVDFAIREQPWSEHAHGVGATFDEGNGFTSAHIPFSTIPFCRSIASNWTTCSCPAFVLPPLPEAYV